MGRVKKVLVLIRRSPLNSVKNAEALRQSVGLTLAENEITVLFIDAGAWLSVPLSPEVIAGGQIGKHIDALIMLQARLKVEGESLDSYGIDRAQVIDGIEIVSEEDVAAEITSADAVIPF